MSHFYLYKIFREGVQVEMSEEEIAELYGVFVLDVRVFIQRDIEEGYVVRQGESHFYLTGKGSRYLEELLFGKVERLNAFVFRRVVGMFRHP
jgi:predicted transcriptional regulator